MKIKEGDEVKSGLDGKDYVVTRIVGNRVVLKLKNGETEIFTGTDSLITRSSGTDKCYHQYNQFLLQS